MSAMENPLTSPLTRVAMAALMLLAASPAQAATVSFGGYEWLVRAMAGGRAECVGGGECPRRRGRLHLKIVQTDGVWSCAEVVMLEPLGFGIYRFEISGRPDLLDRNCGAGAVQLSAIGEGRPDGTNEIDIEFAQWGNTNVQNRLNWTVYPPRPGPEKGHKEVPIALNGAASTHRFTWTPEGVSYGSFHGYADAGEAYPIAKWNYAPEDAAARVPQLPLAVHMNFWLLDGKAPSDAQEAEIVIRSFSFTPL